MDTKESPAQDLTKVHRSPFSFEIVDKSPNPQLFENNPLHLDPVVEAERNDPDRLFSSDDKTHCHDEPNFAIIHEKPEHRLIVYLKAKGLSNKEVADRTGFTQSWISQITRQPWFRLRLVQELKEAGVDQLQQVLKGAALDSVFTLINVRDDEKSPKAAKIAASNSLLDRFLGKPNQTIQHEDKKLPNTSEIVAIEKELETIDGELKK